VNSIKGPRDLTRFGPYGKDQQAELSPEQKKIITLPRASSQIYYKRKAASFTACRQLLILVVSRAGLEPATHWLKGAVKPIPSSHGSYDLLTFFTGCSRFGVHLVSTYSYVMSAPVFGLFFFMVGLSFDCAENKRLRDAAFVSRAAVLADTDSVLRELPLYVAGESRLHWDWSSNWSCSAPDGLAGVIRSALLAKRQNQT